jgi:hypothetical protein
MLDGGSRMNDTPSCPIMGGGECIDLIERLIRTGDGTSSMCYYLLVGFSFGLTSCHVSARIPNTHSMYDRRR